MVNGSYVWFWILIVSMVSEILPCPHDLWGLWWIDFLTFYQQMIFRKFTAYRKISPIYRGWLHSLGITRGKNQRRKNVCLMLPQLQWWRMNSPQEKKCVFLNRDTQYTSQQRCKQDGSYCLVCVVYQCAFAFAFALVLRDADNKSSAATTTNLLPKKNRRVFRAQQGVDCLTPLLVFLSPQTPFIMQTPVNPAGPCGPQQRRGPQ